MNDLALLEVNAGRLDQAVYWMKRSFPLAPNLANTYYHFALPLMLLDDSAAERWLKAGEARFPVAHPTAGHRLQIMLAVGELCRGQSAAAVQRMRNAVAALPRSTECQRSLTDLLFPTGAPDAVERIDQALQQGSGARVAYSGYTPRAMRAFLWLQAGDRERALPLIDAALAENRTAIAAGDRSQHPRYENAALELMRGNRTGALKSLEAAYAAGYRDVAFLKVDPLVAALASEPRFVQVADRITRDVLEMKARVDLSDLDELAKGVIK